MIDDTHHFSHHRDDFGHQASGGARERNVKVRGFGSTSTQTGDG
jgi:hypothetical protein